MLKVQLNQLTNQPNFARMAMFVYWLFWLSFQNLVERLLWGSLFAEERLSPQSQGQTALTYCFVVLLCGCLVIYFILLSLSLRFNGHSPGEHRVSRCLLKQRMMEVVVTAGATRRAELQSYHYHQQTSTKSFLQAGCPSCRPTNSVKALKGYISYSYGSI